MLFLNPHTVQPNELVEGVHLCIETEDRTFVASIGAVHDWACYEGIPFWSKERIATNDDKIGQRQAEQLFPICVKAGLKWRD